MLTEPLPIEIFVATRFSDNDVVASMEDWRVEPSEVQAMLVGNFKEMGIYAVEPLLEKETKEMMVFLLRRAPDISQMVLKARELERKRKYSMRHQD